MHFRLRQRHVAANDSWSPIDGLACWPGSIEEDWSSLGTTLDNELARYDAVIHLRTPTQEHGYNHQNPLRTESAAGAAEIDRRIADMRAPHPRRFLIESTADFLDKVAQALSLLRNEMPECCKLHSVPSLGGATGAAAPAKPISTQR